MMQKYEERYGHILSLIQIITVQLPDKTRRIKEQILKRKKEIRMGKFTTLLEYMIIEKNTCTTFRQIYAGTLGKLSIRFPTKGPPPIIASCST